jgi:hypothetical protein
MAAATWDMQGGKKREASLPPYWPPAKAPIGAGIIGEVREFSRGKITKQDGSTDEVDYVLLGNCVEREGVDNGGTLRFRQVRRGSGDVLVSLSKSLKSAVNKSNSPEGCILQITLTGINEALNGMRVYDVREMTGDYLLAMHEGSVRIDG